MVRMTTITLWLKDILAGIVGLVWLALVASLLYGVSGGMGR